VVEQTGFAIWLTGLPASGKTTLARGLADALREQSVRIQVLDSDQLRRVLTPHPTYTHEERDWYYRVMVYIGELLTKNGVNVAFAATANRRAYRSWARGAIQRFAEVYVRCGLETCMTRDDKGIYSKALEGEVTTVPGLQVPYEAPENPEIVVDTESQTVEEAVQLIVCRLEEMSFAAGVKSDPNETQTFHNQTQTETEPNP
jgi:adenylylsulfate kinase